MKSKKKRAFTLTELLVVVIVIGVLSAVVLPKFNKIIETRKTTEAEEMMAAVRVEQEQRCSLNKLYTNDFTKLTNVIPSNSTKNYTYNFTQNLRGVSATSKGSYKYTLKMPSYADGRICCDTDAPGNQCDKLNKDYPPCNELIARADYTATEESCNPPIPCPGASEQSCGCNNSGTQTRTCDTATGQWSAWSACQGVHCECAPEGGYTNTKPCGCNNSGTQTRTCDTSTGTWGAWSSCTGTYCQCPNDGNGTSRYCSCNGTQTRTCNTSTGVWSGWSSCSGATSAQTRTVSYTPSGKQPSNCATKTEEQVCSNHSWTWVGATVISSNEGSCCSTSSKPSTSCSGGSCNGSGTRSVTCSNGSWHTGSCSYTSCGGTRPQCWCASAGQYHYGSCNSSTGCYGSASCSGCEQSGCHDTNGVAWSEGAVSNNMAGCTASVCFKCNQGGVTPIVGPIDPTVPHGGWSSLDGSTVFSFYYAEAPGGGTNPPGPTPNAKCSTVGSGNCTQSLGSAQCICSGGTIRSRSCSEAFSQCR